MASLEEVYIRAERAGLRGDFAPPKNGTANRFTLSQNLADLKLASSGWRAKISGSALKLSPVCWLTCNHVPGERGEIRYFSPQSRRRLQTAANRLNFTPQCMTMLSYGETFPSDGRVVKRMWNSWRQLARYYGVGHYLKFDEFQKRGAPHIHVVCDKLPAYKVRLKLAGSWARLCRKYLGVSQSEARKIRNVHANENNWQAPKSSEGLRRYAVKYGAKCRQKLLPDDYTNPGRFWSTSRGALEGWAVCALTREEWIAAQVELYCLSKSSYLKNRIESGRGFLVLGEEIDILWHVFGRYWRPNWSEQFWKERQPGEYHERSE